MWHYFLCLAVLFCPGRGGARAALAVDGPLSVPAHQLVRLKATGQPPTAAVHWSVSPAGSADVEELDGRLLMAAPPGDYVIVCRAIQLQPGGKTVSETVRVRLTVYAAGPAPTPPAARPATPPATGHQTKEQAEKALCLLRVGGSGCTATIIGPRRPDGRWDVFTAAHCLQRVGTKGTIRLQDGRTLNVTSTWVDLVSDGCWLVTDAPVADVPFAYLAKTAPPVGTPVWQAGYGVATKRATRRGAVSSGPDERGKLYFGYLSGSPGDSGGGIFRSDTHEVVASLYGTEKGITCGCSAVKAAPNRPAVTADSHFSPFHSTRLPQ